MARIKQILLILSILLSGCQSDPVKLEKPPKELIGKFVEVSDAVIQGWEKPIIIEVNDTNFHYSWYANYIKYSTWPDDPNAKIVEVDERVFEIYPIIKVTETEDNVVIHCEKKDVVLGIHETQFVMEWKSDGFVYVSELVLTGFNDDREASFVGKFVNRDYLIEGTGVSEFEKYRKIDAL